MLALRTEFSKFSSQRLNWENKKVNRKVQKEPQAEVAANPRRKRKSDTDLVCIAKNKCTISTKTSSLFPKQGDQNAKRTDRQRAEQDQREAPRSVNYRATQNKNNIGTTALERSVVYTTGGLKAFHCTNFILGSDIILNTKNT